MLRLGSRISCSSHRVRTPFMLDSYESEYDDLCRDQNKHALELDQLRNANRSLSTQV